MAQRRMFSKAITNSARFLMMPQTSRLLYYDLGMAADDDGIVEAFTVLRTTGAADDDLRVLATRGFIVILNDDLVSFITDWKTNNTIRTDRYRESIYSDLLVKVIGETTGLPNGNQTETQSSIGKDSISQNSISQASSTMPTVQEIADYCRENDLKVDAQSFFDYYSSRDWMTGNETIHDWKALVRHWAKTEMQKPQKKNQITTAANYKAPNSMIDVSLLDRIKEAIGNNT